MKGAPLVVLIGPPGAGKTRLGKRVARILGVPFIDTDRRIVAGHGPIADIFAQLGEPHFRAIERSVVAKALTESAVVSLGGGAILDRETQADLATHRVAMITVALRIAGGKRPLVRGVEDWSALVEARRATYERLAARSWDTSDRPLDGIAVEIADWVKENE
ncbi:MAG: shikimate kinase [Actinomycetota bacterium]